MYTNNTGPVRALASHLVNFVNTLIGVALRFARTNTFLAHIQRVAYSKTYIFLSLHLPPPASHSLPLPSFVLSPPPLPQECRSLGVSMYSN